MKTSRLLVPVLLLAQSIFIGSTYFSTASCLFAFVLATLVVFLRNKRSKPGERQPLLPGYGKTFVAFAYVAMFAVVTMWRFGFYGERLNPIAFGFDVLAHFCCFVSLILWTRHLDRGHPAMLSLGLIVVMLCVASGGASQSLRSQTTIAITTAIGFVFAANAIFGARQSRHLVSSHNQGGRIAHAEGRRTRMLVSGVALTGVMLTTTAIARVTSDVLPDVQNVLHKQLSSSVDELTTRMRIGSSQYVRGGRIGSVRRHMLSDPSATALRIHAGASPGYLRGNVFDRYARRRWSTYTNASLAATDRTEEIEPDEVLPSSKASSKLSRRSTRPLRRFQLQEKTDDRTANIEVHNDPLKGAVVFTPLATEWIDASARKISLTKHKIVESGIDLSNPYVCGVVGHAAVEPLHPERERFLLSLPTSIRDGIREIASEVCRDRPTAAAKANAIRNYFQLNFQYSLSNDPPEPIGDPVLAFLRTKHPAHCEYFASATVLMLRSVGVPARYVTGYVADEYSDEENYWLARNRDAHAWAEAYDEISQQWFPVESTPGRSYGSIVFGDDATTDGLSGIENIVEADEASGFFAKLRSMFDMIRAIDPLKLLIGVTQLPLFCFLLFLLWKRARSNTATDPQEIKCKLMLRRVDRFVKPFGFVRQDSETLHQFATRIDSAVNEKQIVLPPHLSYTTQWYREFAEARYKGKFPNAFTAQA